MVALTRESVLEVAVGRGVAAIIHPLTVQSIMDYLDSNPKPNMVKKILRTIDARGT